MNEKDLSSTFPQKAEPKLNWFQKWMLTGAGAYLIARYGKRVEYDRNRKVWVVEGHCPEHGWWTKEFTISDMVEALHL